MNPHRPTPLSHSVRDAAVLTSISEWEIRQAINKGALPARRLGRRLLILSSDLQAWLEAMPRVGDAS